MILWFGSIQGHERDVEVMCLISRRGLSFLASLYLRIFLYPFLISLASYGFGYL